MRRRAGAPLPDGTCCQVRVYLDGWIINRVTGAVVGKAHCFHNTPTCTLCTMCNCELAQNIRGSLAPVIRRCRYSQRFMSRNITSVLIRLYLIWTACLKSSCACLCVENFRLFVGRPKIVRVILRCVWKQVGPMAVCLSGRPSVAHRMDCGKLRHPQQLMWRLHGHTVRINMPTKPLIWRIRVLYYQTFIVFLILFLLQILILSHRTVLFIYVSSV
jgi:hypothetical protein